MTDIPARAPYPPLIKARVAMVVLTIAYMLSFIDRQILSLLVEPMKRDLNISDFQVSLLQGFAFAAIYAVAGIPLGRLSDRFNRRSIIITGVAVWSSMTALCGFAPGFATLFFGRTGVGIGEAALSPATYSLLSDYFPPKRLPRALGFYGLGSAVGTGLAYMLGGTILSVIGASNSVSLGFLGKVRPWQAAFIMVGSFGAVVIFLLSLMTEPRRRAAAIEPYRVFTFRATLGFLVRHWRGLGTLYFGAAMLGIQAYASMAWLPSMLVRTFGVQVSSVGITFGAVYMAASVTGTLGGAWCATRLLDDRHRNPYVRWTLICAALATISGTVAPLLPTFRQTCAVCALMIAGQSAWLGVAVAGIQLAVPNQMRATLSSILLFCMSLLGLTIGPSGVAGLTQFVFHDPLALRYSISIVSAVAGTLAVVAMYTSLRHFPTLSSSYSLPMNTTS
jgi:MFS family permease